jgi:hypothetical protein
MHSKQIYCEGCCFRYVQSKIMKETQNKGRRECWEQDCMELYAPSPHTSACGGALLSGRHKHCSSRTWRELASRDIVGQSLSRYCARAAANCMKHSDSSEAGRHLAATHGIPRVLTNLNVHRRVHKSLHWVLPRPEPDKSIPRAISLSSITAR